MKTRSQRHTLSALLAGALLMATLQPVVAEPATQPKSDVPKLSLQTANADEGFALAITLARKAVTETQPDKTVLHALRPEYSHNPQSLIAASHVVAVHFQTIAAANDYWRK